MVESGVQWGCQTPAQTGRNPQLLLMSPSVSPPEIAPRAGSGRMFDGIARRYDLLNRLISFGVDRSWRRQTVEALALDAYVGSSEQNGLKVLDLATGTGDMAITLAERYPLVSVVGVDPSLGMMDVGREKVRDKGLTQRISFRAGDGQALEFPNGTFDGITIAFGIRNVPDRARALREMTRVCKPGAKVAILELSEPQKGLVAALGRFHMHQMVPLIGSLLSGSREYSYLPRSIAAFPPPEDFRAMLVEAGLRNVHVTALTFGVCHLYVGEA
jgi:demethylmenaquinone methyltransferase / 2-methoxy-6-polyprenyl-1,4-benzoquinol methylase